MNGKARNHCARPELCLPALKPRQRDAECFKALALRMERMFEAPVGIAVVLFLGLVIYLVLLKESRGSLRN
jgi:hypothetical protein